MKRILFDLIYDFLYFKVCHPSWRESRSKRYYDNLGVIDTLGYNYDRTPLTESYSDELDYIRVIKLWRLAWSYIDGGCNYKIVCFGNVLRK